MTSVLGPEWHISANGINMLTENGSIKENNQILKLALNTDLKEIGSPILANELLKDQISKVVLQIQKIRNISAPKANEESQAAPRMLKLHLTDGCSHVQALELSTIQSISRNFTPPGTKILINNAKVVSGYILLKPANCTVLGGKVPHLVEKWEIAKSVQRNNRRNSSNDDGPPAWVNFGTKVQTSVQDSSFKSLSNKNKESNKDNSEFELQRQGAIAEATSGAVRKVFGGRVKQNIQPSTQNNNQNKSYDSKERYEKGKNKGKPVVKEREVEDKPSKPSEKVSLFDFLEDKLHLNENQNTAKNSSNASYQTNSINQTSINKNFESYAKPEAAKPYVNPQKNYQNFSNPQNKRDPRQYNYNREEKFSDQNNKYERNNFQQYNPRQVDKQQTNSYPKQFDKQNRQNNNNFRQYERPQQQQKKSEETLFNSKGSQSNNNVRQDNVNELSNNLEKISLNSQFASRSLRQHLNLGPSKKNEETPRKRDDVAQSNVLNVGDDCMAKYWEDGKFYAATITAVTERTYVVKFKGYGNIEEILKNDCNPITANNKFYDGGVNPQNRKFDQNSRPYSGSMEFRRSTRNFK